MQTGRKLGMALMNDSLLRLVKAGQVAPDEALAKSNDRTTLLALFQQSNIPVPTTGN
jgi:Tfp pilus assembly pilus retraction ATPase PilT